MTQGKARGRLSDLLIVRMHDRAEAYLAAGDEARARIVEACRREATVPDLPERILARTIYAQTASRVAPLRELLQNALDASPRGARIDVRSSDDGGEIAVCDRGRGMTRTELLCELLVPFRSGKQGVAEAIGEHGIGFFSALEIAPRLEVTTVTRTEGFRLRVEPIGSGPPYADFAWELSPMEPASGGPTGTTVRLALAHPRPRAALFAEVMAAAGLVDPVLARIYVDDVLVNTARSRMRRVARAPVTTAGGRIGELALYLGRGEGIPAQLVVTQAGLTVAQRPDAFGGADLALHKDLARAIFAAGYGLVAELPLSVPLNKGRSNVAAHAAAAVDRALVSAFERFVLEDALYSRELLRAVDHRIAAVLERLVAGALAGEPPPARAPEPPPLPVTAVPAGQPARAAGATGATGATSRTSATSATSASAEPAPPAVSPAPTVAAPEQVVRFAGALVDAPLFTIVTFDHGMQERKQRVALRDVLRAHRAGTLRPLGSPCAPGYVYLATGDPLGGALMRRLAGHTEAIAATPAAPQPTPQPERARDAGGYPMHRVSRAELLATAGGLPGVPALAAAMSVLESIDAAISVAAGLPPSPISIHQDLYGPDEMAHTDGSGISVNIASSRVRGLLLSVLAADDAVAFGALVDLFLHEKTHVSLASYVPRATAEHGASFYRRKDLLRRRLLQALRSGRVADPIQWLPLARRGLCSIALPSPERLAAAMMNAPTSTAA